MMSEWFFEHAGTLRAVRSKMARIKKNENKYFTRREWKIKEWKIKDADSQYTLSSRGV